MNIFLLIDSMLSMFLQFLQLQKNTMILKKKEINRLRQNIDFKHILYIETLLEIK